jgi:hypothetical protein
MYFRFPGKGTPVTTDRTCKGTCSQVSSVQIPIFHWFLNSEVPNSGAMARSSDSWLPNFFFMSTSLFPLIGHFSKYRLVLEKWLSAARYARIGAIGSQRNVLTIFFFRFLQDLTSSSALELTPAATLTERRHAVNILRLNGGLPSRASVITCIIGEKFKQRQ